MGRVSDPREHDTGVRLSDLDPERPRPLETPWGAFSLYRRGDRVLAAQSFCPHLDGPLFQGTLSGDTITCPWHRWRYSLRTGERLEAPADAEPSPPLARLAARVGPRGTILLRPFDGEGPRGDRPRGCRPEPR